MQRPIIFANGNVKLAKAPTKHEYAREVAHREGVPTVYELAAIHDGARSFYRKTALRALGAVDSCSCTIPASAFAA